ncbi:MAG: SDR family NAD(P)-dependent oxidoreductase [Burkholderiales bacterium]|uniref:SDR family NAD(P)-dependent oxidoreductase n=1 Tax=Limnobacter sp. TaxID=2003368 RepID=UPI0039BCB94A|nr:SDR family NAD(P)-dependent oxidoreductase [Burkholderiales bacterium]
MNHQTTFRDINKTGGLIFKRSLPGRFRRSNVSVAGCGQVGLVLLQTYPAKHFTATYRPGAESEAKRAAILAHKARPLAIDLNSKPALLRLISLGHRIIWMAPPNASAISDNTLKKLVLWAATRAKVHGKPAPRISYISTTGVYGNAQGQWINEYTPLNAQSERAKRRVHAEAQLRLGLKHGVHVHLLRAPGIYGDNRLPIDRIKNGTPALLPEEDAWSNHIHELDLGRLSLWVNYKGAAFEVLNACDAKPSKMGDYFDSVADAFQLPRPPRFTKEEVKQMVSPMMWSFMSESRRIESLNQKKLGFRLRYPSVADFLGTKA